MNTKRETETKNLEQEKNVKVKTIKVVNSYLSLIFTVLFPLVFVFLSQDLPFCFSLHLFALQFYLPLIVLTFTFFSCSRFLVSVSRFVFIVRYF
jgi:uncharacterized integral membrane protein